MLEILKKAGLASGLAAAIVLLVTIVPIGYQWHYTLQQNHRIEALEKKLQEHEQRIEAAKVK